MYKSYFGLRALPFGASPDPRFLFLRPQIQEALACLQYGIAARKGFVVMTGEVGTGKTTLLRAVLDTFAKGRVATAFLSNPRLDVLGFFEIVLTDFGIPPLSRTKSGMLLQLNSWLIERFRARQLCVIVIDEAQNLSWDLLEEMLLNPKVRQLRQRVSLWVRTQALNSEETQAYIGERLRIAGASEPVLLPEAMELVYYYSKGIPRIINLICEHTLINAYAEQVKPIPAHIVESVGLELDLVEHPFTISFPAMQALMNRTLQDNVFNTIAPASGSAENLKELER